MRRSRRVIGRERPALSGANGAPSAAEAGSPSPIAPAFVEGGDCALSREPRGTSSSSAAPAAPTGFSMGVGEGDDLFVEDARDSSASSGDSADGISRYILPEDLLTGHSSDEDGDGILPTPSGVPPTGAGINSSPPSNMDHRVCAITPCTSIFRSVEELYSYLLLRGARQLNEEQYTMVREGFNASSPAQLPSLTRVREKLAPSVLPWMLPATSFELPMKSSKGKVNVQCILPSAHVRRDVAFEATYEKLFEAEKRSDEERSLHPEFVDSPFFTERADILETDRTMHRFTLDGVRVSIGDSLTVVLPPPLSPCRVIAISAFFASHRSGLAQSEDIHAGDLVVTCEGDGDGEIDGSLVARHWMASALPPLSWKPELSNATYHDVVELQVRVAREQARAETPGATPSDAPPSSWRPKRGVMDGVPFATVSLAMNSDDFEARRGKNESLGGVYFSYISMMYQHRRSSNACRTIAATPPTVDSDEVLRVITPDLREGATKGWLCHLRDGTAFRVFVDVAFFVGDYLQICKTSKIMGYGAKSPCPLCIYRVPGVPGSRYGLSGSSADADMARTSLRTRSICRAVDDAVASIV